MVVVESHDTGESCKVGTASCSDNNNSSDNTEVMEAAFDDTNCISPIGLEFRVLRKIGHDSLLVSWSTQENQLSPRRVNGYEVRTHSINFFF